MEVTGDTQFPMSQRGESKKVLGDQIADFARKSIDDLTVSAKTLAPGSAATAKKTPVGTSYNVEFGIPQGAQGPQGPPGGFASTSDWLFGLDVVDGRLILGYTGDEPPPLALEDGHLVAYVPVRIDLGRVIGDPGPKGNPGDSAGFGKPTATVDSNVGTPSVTITASGPDTAKIFNFAFKNLRGEPGKAAGFGTITATVDDNIGTPSVTVTESGTNEKKNLAFDFRNLRGPQGPAGDSFAFSVEDGRLLLHYTNGEPPDISINPGDGHLYMNIA